MKIYKSKLMRIINFIKNESKFERGDMVRVKYLDNFKKSKNYLKYVGQLGIVVYIDYTKKEYIVSVKFEDGQTFDCKIKELEKIQPENPLRYKKLNIEY